MKNFLQKYKNFLFIIILLLLDVSIFIQNPPFNCTSRDDLGECHFDIVVISGLGTFLALSFGLIVYSHIKKNDQVNSISRNMFIGAMLILLLIGVFLFIRTPHLSSTGSFLPLSRMYPVYPANYEDNAILLGASHNVFIAKVVAQTGNRDVVGNPASQFSVEVIKNIKGDLRDVVIVNQEGGYRDGVLYLMEGTGALLQADNTYLLTTRYNEKENWYTLNPHENASKLLTDDANLDVTALQALANQDAKVKILAAAYPEEKLLDADLAHGNTRNAFRDLPEEVKAAARVRAEEARTSLESGSNMQ